MLASNSVTHIAPTIHAKIGRGMVVAVHGRVESVRSDGNKFYTQLLSPSVDAYSSPVSIEITSRRRFAKLDDEVSCNCVLGGFYQNLSHANSDHMPQRVHAVPVVHTLDLVECWDEV
jgi:hypothetical protein